MLVIKSILIELFPEEYVHCSLSQCYGYDRNIGGYHSDLLSSAIGALGLHSE